eukprot:gnl/Hemi2/20635_TR6844_c0_g1_i1.p1 gnl/Hemi2/20635_TR6844_c0_g1~~gnl/Hemi2/20635_TR6844_c0_g1_i1.p1  ORF type:complete len:414 (-),score=25.99 gnl/Hemi2/20635_TR6844_c0_g1_i1:94-1335(-)
MGACSSTPACPDIARFYELGPVIGVGSFSIVRQGTAKATGKPVAIKVIKRSRVKSEKALWNEILVLKEIHHHNVVSLLDVFESPKEIFVVMELMTGGELFERIIKQGHFSERHASRLIGRVLEATAHLHQKGIVHRDLKPENLLFSSPAEDAEIKIADFGLAKALPQDDISRTSCGTPNYIAPEVLRAEIQGYSMTCDIWSLGVILYILLCGFPPFNDDNLEDLFDQILHARFSFPSPYWDTISDSAKDLIRHMLVVDPLHRFTAEQCLEHPWINGSTAPDDHLGSAHARLNNYHRDWRKSVRTVMAKVHLVHLVERKHEFSDSDSSPPSSPRHESSMFSRTESSSSFLHDQPDLSRNESLSHPAPNHLHGHGLAERLLQAYCTTRLSKSLCSSDHQDSTFRLPMIPTGIAAC